MTVCVTSLLSIASIKTESAATSAPQRTSWSPQKIHCSDVCSKVVGAGFGRRPLVGAEPHLTSPRHGDTNKHGGKRTHAIRVRDHSCRRTRVACAGRG